MRAKKLKAPWPAKEGNVPRDKAFGLFVWMGQGTPLCVPLNERVFVVGQSPFNNLTLDGPGLTRRHFEILQSGAGHELCDLSGLGLRLNGQTIARAALTGDDRFDVGPWHFLYRELPRAQDSSPLITQMTLKGAEPQQKTQGELHVTDAQGTRHLTIDRPLMIGSGTETDVCLSDPYASRRHCQLIPSPDGLVLRDLQSLNGTWIDELRVVEVILPTKARFRVGHTVLEISGPAPKEKSTARAALFSGMVGQHPTMQRLFGLISRMAASDQTVLITGETGTGKELAARAIHDQSQRAGEPFVVVNCGAMAAELIESELFGHEKGAFTGATGRRAGAFEAARRGTVFLDEIGELPLLLQAKLLRALENQEIKPVGSDLARKHQARVVAATNRDLRQRIAERQFREDLFFRLSVLPLRLPPLRERREDIPLLCAHFLAETQSGVRLSDEAIDALLHLLWPGNLRELRNVLLTSLVYHPEAIKSGWLSDEQLELSGLGASGVCSQATSADGVPIGQSLAENESRLIAEAMAQYKGQKREVARALGISRSTLYEKLKKYGL